MKPINALSISRLEPIVAIQHHLLSSRDTIIICARIKRMEPDVMLTTLNNVCGNLNINMEKSRMLKTDKTIEYYNENAKQFVETTVNVEFHHMQKRFLDKLQEGAYILDFGCGSGRDTKYFLEQAYQVDAIDGSAELCKLASEFAGIKVKHMYFQELSEVEKYDGIWACSSILHLKLDDLEDVMKKMALAVKANGIIYTSFKYGTFSGERNGRYFTDMTEDTFGELLQRVPGLVIEEQWITSDVRPGRGEEKWLNLILRKN